MEKILTALGRVSEALQAPILCGGDVFDVWNSKPTLINFALDCLPPMIAVPGQHDLPNHRFKDLHESAFGTLLRAKRIRMPTPTEPIHDSNLAVYGFPWKYEIKDPGKIRKGHQAIAIAHEYIYAPGTNYPGAPKSASVRRAIERYKGMPFTAYIHGDNHRPFYCRTSPKGGASIINTGSLLKRKINEEEDPISIAILYVSGHVDLVPLLDTKFKRYEDPKEEKAAKRKADFMQFLDSLRLSPTTLDFREHIKRWEATSTDSPAVKQIVMNAIDPN